MASTLHERCPECDGRGERVADFPPHLPPTLAKMLVSCDRCGNTGRVDSPEALSRIAALEAEVARLRAVLAEGDRIDAVAEGAQAALDRDREAEVTRLRAERDAAVAAIEFHAPRFEKLAVDFAKVAKRLYATASAIREGRPIPGTAAHFLANCPQITDAALIEALDDTAGLDAPAAGGGEATSA